MRLKPLSVTTATYALTKYDFGATVLLNRAAGIAITLPAPAAGAEFHFIVSTAPTTDCTIAASGGSNIIAGGFNELEVDSTEDGPYLADGDTITFVASTAVVGDYCHLRSDGTKWYVNGQTNADGGATITKT